MRVVFGVPALVCTYLWVHHPPMQASLGANVGLSGRIQEALRIGFGVNPEGISGAFKNMMVTATCIHRHELGGLSN